MKLEDIVTSLEISKRLKDIGVKQESLFYWSCFKDGLNLVGHYIPVKNEEDESYGTKNTKLFSAFT